MKAHSGIAPNPIRFIEPEPSPEFAAVVRALFALLGDQKVTNSTVRDMEGSGSASVPIRPTEARWAETWAALQRHRIDTFVPLLLRAGVLELEPEAADAARSQARLRAGLHLSLRAQARETRELLGTSGVDSRVLKGLATAALDHPSQLMRRTSDLDLLVRPHDFEQARSIIARTGAVEIKSEASARLLVETTFLAPSGIEIDLHHRLFRFGADESDLLFEQPAELPDAMGHALSVEARLVHAASHLLVSPPGFRMLSSLTDVSVIRASGRVDLRGALALAERFGVRDVVAFAWWLADAVTMPIGESTIAPPVPARTLINWAFLRSDRSLLAETLAQLNDLDGIRDKATFLGAQMRKRQQR